MQLVHNPSAGDEQHSRDVLLRIVRRFGHDVEYLDARADWKRELRRNHAAELVAVAGGDGTVGDVSRTLAGSGVPIAILPLGTANNISSMLGLTDVPIEELITGWSQAKRRHVDLGVAYGPWGELRFLESIGVGALADSIAEVEHGIAGHIDELDDSAARLAAGMELIGHTLRSTVPRWFEIAVDGRDVSGAFVLVEVLNFGTAGPNLRFANAAKPDDGLLDVVVVRERDRQAMADELLLYHTDPARAPALPVHRGAQVQFRCEAQAFHIDDRVWMSGRTTDVTVNITIQSRALTFLVPG